MMRVLRWIAIAIAIAAAVDPAISISARARPRIAVVVDDWRNGNEALAYFKLWRDFEIVPANDPSAAATVVIGSRYPDVAFPESTRVATVTDGSPGGFASFSAPRSVPPGSAIHLETSLAGSPGAKTELTVSIGNTLLARESHTWTDDQPWRAAFDVVPVGEPPYAITVGTPGVGMRATAVVDVSERLPVLVYEARPSWATVFVRRALESDPRFSVSSVDVASRGVAVSTSQAPRNLQAGDLGRFAVVVVGGLDALSAADSAALDRFMIDDGGSVARIADSAGPSSQEILLDRPAALLTLPPLPRIDASELLVSNGAGGPEGPRYVPAATVLARSPSGDAIVWTEPRGEGRLLFSGALDAWRFRLNSGVEFDRFWQSAIAGLALAARPPLAVDVVEPSEFGGKTRVRVRMRGVDPGQPTTVTATLASGEPVRLWPDAERGSFSGVVEAYRAGVNRIDLVSTNGGRTERASARFADGAYIPLADEPIVPLSLLSATHGGIDVAANDLPKLERWLRETIPAQSEKRRARPMRSAWWMVPFAGCLCGEWWTRRRRGLR